MNEQLIQELEAWVNALLDEVQAILESGEEIPDDVLNQIADQVEDAYAEIDELQEEQPLPTPREPIPAAPHESSQINGFAYDPESGKLQVQFHGKYPQAAGSEYEYDDVPPWVFDLFQRGAIGPKTSGSNRWHRWEKGKTPSHGAAMNALIKAGGFNYRKVA